MNLNEEKDEQVQNPEEQQPETPTENPVVEEAVEATQEVVAEATETVIEMAAEAAEITAETTEPSAEAEAVETPEEDVAAYEESEEEESGEEEPGESEPARDESAEMTEEEVDLPLADPVAAGGAHDDFNWNMDKRGAIAYSDSERAEMLSAYDAALSSIEENAVITGRVSAVSGGDVVLDINYKSDGLIPLNEFRDMPEVKEGDNIEVYVERQEDSDGQLSLSRKKAKILRAWEGIVEAFNTGAIINGTIISKTKGGLIADCNGLETFLPGSQIDIKPVIDYDQYVGKTMEFKVVKINEQIKNAVVSHKALIESDLQEQREQILATLEKGQVLEGIVKNITDFGAFLDLGGVDGLLYITDISWGRISHPSEVLSLNQRVNVVVVDFDENKKRISLSLKKLLPHPWEVLDPNIVDGSVVKGKVVNIEDYGAFVEIMPGVEGLIHISEISWGVQNINAKEYFKMGQELEARVVSIDRNERKMSLSIKQLTEDPWSTIEERYPIGSIHTAVVKNLTNYGIFAELSEGMGGMIHISDLSWIKRYGHPSEFTKVGAELLVKVLDIDKEKRQISLGHKQTEENPWDSFQQLFPIGSYHEATVVRRDDKGATFLLPHDLEGFAPAKHIRKEDGSVVEPDEKLTVKVLEFNSDERRIIVSHTRYWEDLKYQSEVAIKAERAKEAHEAQKAITEVQKKVEKETLGDLDIFSQLKEQLGDSKE